MSKLIRHAQKRGTALFLAMQLTGLILLSLLSFIGGPQQSPKAPAETQVSAPAQAQTEADQTQTAADQDQTQTDRAPSAPVSRESLRKSAHFGKKLYEPLASQVFSLQRSRVELQAAQRPSQGPESPNTEPTLTTDREDYPPYSYVYFHGAGFEPGETVQMIVAETDPVQQSFEPWEVVADANGEFDTSWFIYSSDFQGAAFLATATGETSQLTASVTFTDASGSGTMNVSPGSAVPGSSGNSFTFSFRTEAGVSFGSSSAVSVVVPTGWTTPQTTTPGNPGYVSVVAVGSATVGSPSVSGTGPWTITVPVTSISAGTTNGLDITYAGGGTKVTAPSTSGVYAFTAGSRSGGSGATTSLDTSPLIAVSTSSIFQRGSATKGTVTGATSITINTPTGVVAGDVMIVNIEMEGGTSFPSLAGWTNVTTPTTFGSRRMALLYKVAGGSEPTSYTFTWTGNSDAEGAIVAFAGVDTSGSPPVPPFDVTPGSYTTGSGTTITGVTSISTVTANAAVLMFAATRNDSLLSSFATTSPGALTQSYANITQGIGGAWNFKAAAGSTGAGSADISKNRDWAAILLALRPAQGCTCTVTLSGQGSNTTIQCPASPTFTAPTASDSCGFGTTVNSLGDTTTAGTCANKYTAARSWRATDTCGNTSATVTQTITVTDTTAPTIGSAGSNATIQCPATPSFTAPTASDACGTSTVVQDSDTTAAGTCNGTYSETKTWHAVDACGNTSVSRTQTITVADTTAPTIGSPGANNTVECPASPSFTAPTASDTCSGATVQNLGDTTTAGTCANNFTVARSWRAVDGCGNTSGTVTQTSTVRDTTPPVIGAAGSNATIQCPATPSFTVPTASDACGGSTVQDLGATTTAGTCANNYTSAKSWKAVDACSNTSGTVTQTITVRDTTAPAIGGQGSNATIECPASPTFTAPTVSDTCSGATVENLGDTTSGNACALVTTRSWRAVDGCGNTSGTVSQSSTRVDTTNPTIGSPGADNTVECPASPSFTAPSASDTCSGATVENLGDTTSGNACALVTTRSWRAVDGCGNTSGTVSQSSTRVDTTNPEIGSPGADNTVECPASPSFTAPTVSDTCSGATVENLGDTTSGNACALVTTRSWRAVDGCGNTSGTVSQSSTRVDTTNPEIGSPGADNTVECPASPSFTAPTVSDTCSGATVENLGDTTSGNACALVTTRSWRAVDGCGNTSGTVSQSSTRVDTTNPEIGSPGADNTVECPASPSFTAPTVSDTCSGATVENLGDTTSGNACALVTTRSWRAVDGCGNTSGTVSQSSTRVDTTNPEIGSPGADNTVECPASPSFTAPSASDTCSGATVENLGDTTSGNACALVTTRSWRAVDGCGNTSGTVSQSSTRVDTTNPTIGSPGADNTVECPASPSFTAPSASDTCSGATVENLGDTTSGNACALVTTRSWRAVDGCGNTSGTVSQSSTRVDTTNPEIGSPGADNTVECPATPSFTAPTVSDTCSGATVENLGDTTSGNACALVTTRSWRAVDGCGNTSGTVSQSSTRVDTTNPEIGSPGADNTVECPATPSFTAPTVSDTCSGATVENLGDTTSGNACALVTTRSWRAVDGCGNTSGTVSQSSTRVDTTNPTIGSPGADNTVECPASPSFTAPTVSDTCSGATVEDLGDTTSGNACALVTTRSWRAVDGCGNTSETVSQRSTRVDTTNPTIGSPGADNTVECPASPSFTAPSVSDTCSGATVENLGDTTSGNACALVTTRSWRAVDGCGNTSGTVSQSSTRVDTTNPTIGSPGADNTVECPASPSFTAPSASDTCSGATVENLGDTTSGNACALVTTRSWRAVDGCGNTSGTVSQSSTRVDTTNPTIGSPGADNTVECPATPSFTAPTVSDTCSGATVENLGDTTSGNACALVTTRSWRAVDGCGNTSGTVSQSSTRVDTTNPTIGSPGADNTVECPASPSFTAPTVSDTCSGATVEDLGDTTSGNSCALVTTRSWRAVDGCGNTSGTVSQSSTRVDTTNPEIGSPGADNTVECPATPSFTAPTVSDTCSGATVENLGDTTSGNSCALVTTRSWRAVDGCGNTSGTVTQSSTRVDTTNPEIGSPGADNTVECPATPSFTAPTVSDTCSGATVQNLGDTTSGNACALVTTRSWRAVDGCGNTSGTVTQSSTRVDTTNPEIGSPGADNTVECPATPSFMAPTVSDTCSGATVEDLGDTTSGNACALVTTRSWRAVDGCGNTSGTVSQSSTRVDTTNPEIGSPGADNTVECPATPSFTAPTVSDTCSGATVENLGDTTSGNSCALVTTRSWRAVDGCGNTSGTVSQSSTRVDTTNPEIGSPGADNTVECPATPSFTAPTVSDTCSGATVENLGDTTSGNSCALVTTRSWRAVDGCGNTSGTVTQSSTRVDTTNPEIGSPGADNTVECPGSPSFTAPTVSDTCSGATVQNLGDTTSGNACALVTTRSWRAVDGCGNTSGTVTQSSTRVDTTNPEIGSPGADNTVECPASPSFTAPTVSDTCSGATVQNLGDTTSGNACALVTTRSWRAVDGCGNTSGTVTQTSTRVDTTAPVIGGQGSNATIECSASPSFTAPTASDACGGSTVQDLGATTTAGTCANNYTSAKSWKAVDACGNTSGTVTQTITVRDTTAPTIGGQGSNATIECPATPSFTAPTASDACGGSTVQDLGATTTAGTCANNYTSAKSWKAVDACGNTSGTVTQTITVRDTTAPTIGSPGADNTVECPASPSFTAPTVSDTCSGATVQNLGDTTSGNACALVTTRSWRAVDGCGNTSGTVTQSSTRVDTTAPVIGAAGGNATIQCPVTPSFTAPTASDACGGSTVVMDSDTTAAGTCANNYSRTRTWHAVDACGNTSASRSQTITVVDNTPPTIGGQGGNATIECPATPSFTAPTASDACGGSTVVQDSDTTAAGTCANGYSRTKTWHAVDACGNTSGQVSQTVTVRDTTAPTIGAPGANTTIACNGTPVFTPPTASDACGTATVQQVSDSTTTSGTNTLYTRCWRAVDACNNTSATVCQTITRPLGPWHITGFYPPVDMVPIGVVNTVKGGSTVPLKFNVYDCFNVERTSVSDVVGQTCQVAEYGCSGGPEDPMGDLPNTGATVLRYDTTGHQFIQNWAVPKPPNRCYRVRMTTIDGSVIEALFKTK